MGDKGGSISCHKSKMEPDWLLTSGYCLISRLQQEDDVVRMNLRPCLFDRRNRQFERRTTRCQGSAEIIAPSPRSPLYLRSESKQVCANKRR